MKKLLVIAALLISTESVADLDWSGKTKVTALYPHGEGLQFFISTTSLGKYSTCGQKRFSLGINARDYNVMVSLLTTAFVAGKEVDIAIDTNTVSSCNPAIHKFKMYN
jgi:hypothetical protein